MTITLNAPATSYVERLKKQSGSFVPKKLAPVTNSSFASPNAGGAAPVYTNPIDTNQSPDFLKFQNPNEHFGYQQSLQQGAAPQSGTDRINLKGLQERDMAFAQGSDIANQKSQADLVKRQWEANKQLQSMQGQGYEGAIDDALSDFTGSGAGSGLTAEQLGYARQIAQIGKSRGMDATGIKIALMTALAESGLRNLNYGDRDSVGLFQQRTSQGWGTLAQIMNPTYSAGKFYDTLKQGNWRDENPWLEAQHVQRSAFADGSNYRDQWSLANQAYNAIFGPKVNPQVGLNNPALKGWIERHNNRYLDYDNAYGAQCVDLYDYYVSGFLGGEPKFVGIAAEIYHNYDSRVFNRFDRSVVARAGDVAIWNVGPGTPGSHVAIVIGDNGDGTLRVLHSNATPQGSRGNSTISNISKGALAGYLRPKKLGR